MLSLQDIAAIKFATVICNDPQLKKKILYTFDGVKIISGDEYDIKQKWDEIVETQAMVTLRSRGLPKILQEKVMGVVPAIGMSMLNWAVYHENILKFSRQYSIDFFNSSFFTQQGNIDNKKAAEELMKDKSLSVEQKYKIACLYCFTDHIPVLFKQMTKGDREKLCSIRFQSWSQPALVRFWSDYQMSEVDELRGGETLDQYRLEKAIQSGSKAGVEYCFEKTNLRTVRSAIVEAAVEAVRNRIRERCDTIAFRHSRYGDDCYNHSVDWVPSEYYLDIVCFLLSKMTEDQKIEFLKKDIEGIKYPRNFLEHNRSRVLEYFLNWPYQGYFMKTAELMWEFLPEENYADLLLKICDKIEPAKEKNLNFGEEKSYDYRGLLKEFWYKSPERYKRYVLSNEGVRFHSTCVGLLIKLLSLKNFTFEDGQIIGIILATAEDDERENILSSWQWRSVLIDLMKEDKFEILDRFLLSRFSSTQVNKFKRELIFSREFHHVVLNFVNNDKWDAVESALKWSSLSGEEVNKFKKEMIDSDDSRHMCLRLIFSEHDVEVANKFIKWCTASEEEIREYKEKLISSEDGIEVCKYLVLNDNLEMFDKVTNCCLFSQEKTQEFKAIFQSLEGQNICIKLISHYWKRISSDGYTIMFKGGKWEEVEKFLTWCFSSEDQIIDFKKCLFRDSGTVILLNLITSGQFTEAETFFAWLGLSIDELEKLKKDTVLDREFILFFHKLLSLEDSSSIFVYYGSKKYAIEVILRWCFTDKETVFEFKDQFKNLIQGLHYYEGDLQDVLSYFDLMIEQHLEDIHEKQTGEKRKSETVFSPNKKLCIFELENLD